MNISSICVYFGYVVFIVIEDFSGRKMKILRVSQSEEFRELALQGISSKIYQNWHGETYQNFSKSLVQFAVVRYWQSGSTADAGLANMMVLLLLRRFPAIQVLGWWCGAFDCCRRCDIGDGCAGQHRCQIAAVIVRRWLWFSWWR